MHGAHFRRQPAHGLQRGVVITDLHAAAHEILLLKDDHAAALVRLEEGSWSWIKRNHRGVNSEAIVYLQRSGWAAET